MKHVSFNGLTRLFSAVILSAVVLPLSAQEAADSAATDSLTKELQEVTVQASAAQHDSNHTIYTITRQLRNRADDTGEMLGNLPEMYFNRITRKLEFNGKTNIKILVDSMEKDETYIQNLHHVRFNKIDVIRFPSGKYAGYDVLINLHTKENYEGYDAYASTSQEFTPRYSSGHEFSNSHNLMSFTYTRNKWTVSVNPVFNWSRNESYSDFENAYLLNDLQEKSIPNPGHEPNRQPYMRGKSWDLNIDYQFNKNHSISATYYYGKEDNDTYSRSTMLTGALNAPVLSLDTVHTRSVARDNGYRHTWGLYYRGKISGWDIWTGANYSHNPWRTRDETERSSGFMIEDNQRQQLNYTWINVDINRSFLDNKLGFNVGYENMWRKYRAKRLETLEELTSSLDRRNRWYTTITYRPSTNTSLDLSGGMTFNNSRAGNIKENQVLYTLGARLTHNFNRNVYASIMYQRTIKNPLAQTRRDYGQFTDSLWWSGGNPELKSSTDNYISANASFFNTFSLSGNLSISPDVILNMIEERTGMRPDGTVGPYIASQPQNTYQRQWYISGRIYRKIKNVRPSLSLAWTDNYASYKDFRHHRNGCIVNAMVDYYPTNDLNIAFMYYYNASPSVQPQSYGKNKKDNMRLFVSKSWLKGDLRVMVDYRLPVHFFTCSSESWTETPAYINYSHSNPEHYSTNQFQISIMYRITGGKSVRQYKRTLFGGN